MDPGWVLLVVLAACLGGGVVALLGGRRAPGSGAAIDRRLAALSADLDRRLAGLDQRLWLGLDTVQHGQAEAQGAAAEVRERIAHVSGIAQQMLDHARELGKLEDLLRPPQARGAFGEVLLEQLLSQGLPTGAWRTQHAFRSGARVDAVLELGQGLVPVDAKFPLDAFARMADAAEEPGRSLHRRAFSRDVRRHVDAIADKYIRPDEGTFDFALCYVPSEAVYYEFLRDDEPGESLFRYATGRRVFPVSPSTFYAYLVSVSLGLRGLRVEANARRVLDALQGLQGDLERFRADFELVGRHLGNARGRWDEAARRLDRFDWRLAEVAERADELEPGTAGGAEPTALPDEGAAGPAWAPVAQPAPDGPPSLTGTG
jgi:DNA recombination protein RmuC